MGWGRGPGIKASSAGVQGSPCLPAPMAAPAAASQQPRLSAGLKHLCLFPSHLCYGWDGQLIQLEVATANTQTSFTFDCWPRQTAAPADLALHQLTPWAQDTRVHRRGRLPNAVRCLNEQENACVHSKTMTIFIFRHSFQHIISVPLSETQALKCLHCFVENEFKGQVLKAICSLDSHLALRHWRALRLFPTLSSN